VPDSGESRNADRMEKLTSPFSFPYSPALTAPLRSTYARLTFDLGPRDHVNDIMIELYWLPIRWRIEHKLDVLMHGIITGKCRGYLQTTGLNQVWGSLQWVKAKSGNQMSFLAFQTILRPISSTG